MVEVVFTYMEIEDEDFTGVFVDIIDGKSVYSYQNFPSEDYSDSSIWVNQKETFKVPSLELAEEIILSNVNMEARVVSV